MLFFGYVGNGSDVCTLSQQNGLNFRLHFQFILIVLCPEEENHTNSKAFSLVDFKKDKSNEYENTRDGHSGNTGKPLHFNLNLTSRSTYNIEKL